MGSRRIGRRRDERKGPRFPGHDEGEGSRRHVVVLEAGEAGIVVHHVCGGDTRIGIRGRLRHEDAGIARTIGYEVFERVQMVVRSGGDGEEEEQSIESGDPIGAYVST
jgi:hypothetical protein